MVPKEVRIIVLGHCTSATLCGRGASEPQVELQRESAVSSVGDDAASSRWGREQQPEQRQQCSRRKEENLTQFC